MYYSTNMLLRGAVPVKKIFFSILAKAWCSGAGPYKQHTSVEVILLNFKILLIGQQVIRSLHESSKVWEGVAYKLRYYIC